MKARGADCPGRTAIQPLRSFLFAPRNHALRIEKALSLDADAVILDLEDRMAPTHRGCSRREPAVAGDRGTLGFELRAAISLARPPSDQPRASASA
jgi:hypothetical protein